MATEFFTSSETPIPATLRVRGSTFLNFWIQTQPAAYVLSHHGHGKVLTLTLRQIYNLSHLADWPKLLENAFIQVRALKRRSELEKLERAETERDWTLADNLETLGALKETASVLACLENVQIAVVHLTFLINGCTAPLTDNSVRLTAHSISCFTNPLPFSQSSSPIYRARLQLGSGKRRGV